jgi:NADP-dependent 3-hydroxy acid dehydrogenase YdfG
MTERNKEVVVLTGAGSVGLAIARTERFTGYNFYRRIA